MQIFKNNLFTMVTAGVLSLAIVASSIAISPTANAITSEEKNHCSGYGKVANDGKDYKLPLVSGKAKLTIWEKGSGSNSRFCAVLVNYTKEKQFMTLKIGTRKQGNTSNKVTYKYTDSGYFFSYAGGVALTPSKGKCAAVYAKVTLENGATQTRKFTYNLCN